MYVVPFMGYCDVQHAFSKIESTSVICQIDAFYGSTGVCRGLQSLGRWKVGDYSQFVVALIVLVVRDALSLELLLDCDLIFLSSLPRSAWDTSIL